MELVVKRDNVVAALKRVQKNKGSPGIDGMTVESLREHLRETWPALREQLLAGTYRPRPVKRQLIPKGDGGVRELGIPTALDRFVQQALLQVLQPRIDPSFSSHRHGFRGYSFWVDTDETIRRRVADRALATMKDRVRSLTIRHGRSLASIVADLRSYLAGWKQYFRLAEVPRTFRDLDGWIRHRLRAIQLKHWRRFGTILRKLRALGLSAHHAGEVATNAGRWWKHSAHALNRALPIRDFDGLGLPRLAT